MKKRILAMLLCIAMVLSVMPVAAFATEATETPEVLAAEETVEIVEETTEAAVEETEAAEETVAEEAAEETVAEEAVEAAPEATEAAEEAVEEIVPQETEAVTEEIIEVPGDEETVKNSVTYDEENGMYWFETFEDLLQLANQWPEDQWASVRYKGTGDLTITTDLVIPSGMAVQVHGCNMIIPEGVVYTNIGNLQADNLVINGSLVNQSNVYAGTKLEVNGYLKNEGTINLSEEAEVIGKENIFFGDWAFVFRNVHCENKEELYAALAMQGSEGERWGLQITLTMSENMTLDRDVYIAEKTMLTILSSVGDISLTVPAGCTFHVDSEGSAIEADVVVKGTFKHDKGWIYMNTEHGSLTFVDNGAYSGNGYISVSDPSGVDGYARVIKGLDMSRFEIECRGSSWSLRDVSNLARLAAPTDLTWHKTVEWKNGDRVLMDKQGAIAFKPVEPSKGDYKIQYWVEQDGEFVFYSESYAGYSPDYEEMPEWLSDDLLVLNGAESGNYKFSVQAVCWDEIKEYLDSEEVFSDVFTYVKPTEKLSTPVVKGIEKNKRDGFDAVWENNSGSENVMIKWYWLPTADGTYDEYYNCVHTTWGEFLDNRLSADEWMLQDCGTGYYAFRVRVLSDDITKTDNSDWSAFSEPYYHYDPVSVVRRDLQAAIENAYMNPSFNLRKAIQALDDAAMVEALEKDSYGMFQSYMQEAEYHVANGPASVKIGSGFTAMTADQISVIGANLNDGNNIALVVGKAAKSHALAADYQSPAALSFSMKLENVSKQEVPIVVTLPLPAGINPTSAVVVHHASGGDEYLKPISYSSDAITVVVTDCSDFTITQKTFSQADFEAALKEAIEKGEYEYRLEQPVVLTKDLTLRLSDTFFHLYITDGGSLTISKGVNFTTDAYILVGGTDAELNVDGTLAAEYIEVTMGTMTVAKGATVKTQSGAIGLMLRENAKLVGWEKSKTDAYVEVSDLKSIENYFAQVDQYSYMGVYVVGEEPVVINKNLTIPTNAMLALNYGSMVLNSGKTLTINGQLSVFWNGLLDVKEGAKVVNNSYFSLYEGTLNMNGTYSGCGMFDAGPEHEFSGKMLYLNYDYPDDNTMALMANVMPADPNVEYVWEILEGEEYSKLEVNGNIAIVSDRVEITEKHEITIKVSTKDGKVSNTFIIWAVPNEEVDPDHKHDYATEVERVEPTPTEDGYVIYGCECGETKKETIKATGLGKPVVTVDNDEISGAPYLTWSHAGTADSYKISRATSKSGTYKVIATVTEASYVDTTATTGKTYYYKIEAVCAANSKLNSKSDAATAYAKCATPTLMSAEINKATGKPVFTWAKVTGAKKYEVYRTSAEDMTYVLAGTTTALTFEDKGAEVGKDYVYTFRAVASKSAYNGVEGEALMMTAICAQPDVTITLNNETGMPLISWEAVDGAVLYRVCSVNEAGEATLICEQNELTYQEGNVGPGVLCAYKVQAVGAKTILDSALSETVSIYSAIGTPVMSAEIHDVTGKPMLTWTNVEGATSYKVYRSTKATKSYKEIAEVETQVYLDESVAVGKTVYYKVLAVVGDTTSEYSNYEKVTAVCAQPLVMERPNAKTGKPVIWWDAISGAKKYEVYRATESDGEFKKIATVSGTSFEDSKATVGMECYYMVKAIGSKAAYNSAMSDVCMDTVICAMPAVTATTDAATGKPVLTWKAVAGAKSYWIGRQLPSEVGMTEIAVVTDLKFVDLEVSADTEVTYSVVALAEIVGCESWETWVTVRSTIASPVVEFEADTATGKPKLSWDAVDGAVSYKIYRSSKATKSYKVIDTVTDLEYIDTSVSAGKGYYYKVMAVGENCESAYSAYARIYANCAQPQVSLTANAKDQTVLTWEKVTGAKKYEVYRATDVLGNYKKLTTTTKTTYTDKKADKDQTYFYQIKAVPSSSKYASVPSVPVARIAGQTAPWAAGKWYAEGLTTSGEELEKFRFELANGEVTVGVSYYHLLEMEVTQKDLDFYKANGYLIDNHGVYCYDLTLYNDKYYASAMFGGFDEGTYVEDGDTVTMTLVAGHWEEEVGEDEYIFHEGGTVVLKKNNDGTCTVQSIDGVIVDGIVTEVLLANPVLRR